MLLSNLRSILGGLLICFLLQGGVLAATVDGPDLPRMTALSGTPLHSDSGQVAPGRGGIALERQGFDRPRVDPLGDGDRADVFAWTELPRPSASVMLPISLDPRSEPAEVAAETGFIQALLLDADVMTFPWHGIAALEAGSAGWQILLPSLPDAQLRHLFGSRMSPTFLMFASGLAGLAFLARCRPRRRGQLGLMT